MLEISIHSHYAFEGEQSYHLKQTDAGYALDYESRDYNHDHETTKISLSNEEVEPLLKTLFDQKLPARKSTLSGLDGVMNKLTINQTGKARTYHWWGEGDKHYQGLMCFVDAIKQLARSRMGVIPQSLNSQTRIEDYETE